jgi:predicted glycosyltransferase
LEKKFITIASKLGIPSISLLDFWTNYTWRFSDELGNLAYVPDKIAIMDQYTFDEMVREGFDPTRLVITGQPVFDDLAEWRKSFSPSRSKEIRRSLGLKTDELFVLFASQPLTSLYGSDVLEDRYLGFDEWTVLAMLIDTLEEIKTESGANIHLVIRPHPRESADMFQDYRSDFIPISIVHQGTARSQVMAADLVIGMNTELLVEACYLGCIAVSLQPGLRHPDRLPTNRLGFSRAVYDPKEIKPVIHELLLDEKIRDQMKSKVKEFRLAGKATGNVARIIYEMLQIN